MDYICLADHVYCIICDSQIDVKLREEPADSKRICKCRVKQGYLNAHSEFLTQEQHGGACCVTVIIHSWNLAVLNASDSRAAVCNGGVAEASVSSLS
nr:probable protein phosphatase 2C 25 [Tanacetum cinerariifolium]